MDDALTDAFESFRERLALIDARDRARKASARLTRKGNNNYIISAEAREMRRIDAICSEARYA
jgi:hypothetical protein